MIDNSRQSKKKPLPDWGRGYKIILYFLKIFYPLRIEIALLACSSVIPSYGLVKMKCGTWESRITYSSSIITYRISCFAYLDSHEAISTPLFLPSNDGVISFIFPGKFRTFHNSFIASNPRYFQDDSTTMSASVASMSLFNCFTALWSKGYSLFILPRHTLILK